MKKLNTYYEIKIPSNIKNRAMSLILEHHLTYKKSKLTKNFLVLLTNKRQKNQICSFLEIHKLTVEVEEIQGLLSLLCPLKGRIGLYIGVLFLFIALFFSQRVVWRIDIIGNTSVSKEEIIKELESAGLNLGTYIPNIDYDILHNKVLLNSEALAWLSVNINGNVANVVVKEKEKTSEAKEKLYTNIVAKSDGYIDSIVVMCGKKEVKIGDVVKKGDILISGITDSQALGVKYEHASGVVKAYVNKEINIKIPLKTTEKVYTGNVIKQYNYKIYNFPLKFLSKYSNLYGFYDTIEKKEMMSLLGVSDIPLEIVTTAYYEYKIEEVIYTEKQASNLAFSDLTAQLNSMLNDSELISKSVVTSCDGEYFYLNCKIYCKEDIAEEKEIFISK